MRASVDHSGSVNGDERYTFRLVEIRLGGANISVDNDVASLRVTMTEAELRNVIERGRAALADARLYRRFHDGELSADKYEAARLELDRTSFAEPEGSPT